MSEHEHQAALFSFVRLYQDQIPELRLLFAIPNGGWRHIATAKRLKDEGVRKGIPDMMFPVARQGYHGLFIEIKVGRNCPTIDQQAWIDALTNQGYRCEVCYSWTEAVQVIWRFLGRPIPFCERLPGS